MGFCYDNRAGRVLDIIDAAAAAQPGTSNEYQDKRGQRYFYEVERKDWPDGGIRGSIHKLEGENMARQAGRFRITGDGRLIQGPAFFYEVVEASGKARPDPLAGIGGRMGTW